MKKLVLIAAAVAAIASCAKVETINTAGSQQIAFEGYNFGMTKTTKAFNGELGVYASKNADGNTYFTNTKFTKKAEGQYAGDRYWPTTGTLDFTLYAPYNAGTTTTRYGVTSIEALPQATDFLYGESVLSGKQSSDGILPIVLKHAKCMVVVNVQCPSAKLFQVTKVDFGNQGLTGKVAVTYTEAANGAKATTTWTTTPANFNFTKDYVISAANTPEEYGNALLIPSDTPIAPPTTRKISTITVDYGMKDGTNDSYNTLQKVIDLSQSPITLEEGKKYIFNLTFSANEILFNPSVEDWTEVTGGVQDQTI